MPRPRPVFKTDRSRQRSRWSRTGFALASFAATGLIPGCASSVGDINDRALLVHSEPESRATSPAEWLPPPAPGEYRLGPRDLLEIEVYELEEPGKTKQIRTRISQDGQIVVPLIGSVDAGNRTAAEVQAEIEERLRSDYLVDPSVNVLVASYESRTVTVLGAVEKAGTFRLRQNSTTLLDALALAGGPTTEAGAGVFVLRAHAAGDTDHKAAAVGLVPGAAIDLQSDPTDAGHYPFDGEPAMLHEPPATKPADPVSKVDRSAPRRRLLRIDLTDLVERGDLSNNCTLQHGDVVHVPTAERFFVSGLVNDAGSFALRDKVTVLKAVAMAGGLKDHASPGATVLIRRTKKGRKTIPLDLDEIEAGSKNDLAMQSGDVLVISETDGSRVLRSIGDAFRGLFNVAYTVR